jgi:hypothetical protein
LLVKLRTFCTSKASKASKLRTRTQGSTGNST